MHACAKQIIVHITCLYASRPLISPQGLHALRLQAQTLSPLGPPIPEWTKLTRHGHLPPFTRACMHTQESPARLFVDTKRRSSRPPCPVYHTDGHLEHRSCFGLKSSRAKHVHARNPSSTQTHAVCFHAFHALHASCQKPSNPTPPPPGPANPRHRGNTKKALAVIAIHP